MAKGPGSSPWDAGGRLADLGDGNGDWEVVAESVLIDRWPCCRTELASGVDTALTVDGSLVDDERFSNSQTLSRSGPELFIAAITEANWQILLVPMIEII